MSAPSPSGDAFALTPSQLRRTCDVSKFNFETTAELTDGEELLGQERAADALRTGIAIRREGFNVFVMGTEGLGRHTLVQRLLKSRAAFDPAPPEWCYVFNFNVPHMPRALKLPPGRAVELRHDMNRLVEDLRTGIPAAFESDEYRTRRHEIESSFGSEQEKAIESVSEKATARGIVLLRTPAGFGFAPADGDGVMSPEDFRKLPEARRQGLENEISQMQEELERVFHDLPRSRREAQRRLRELNRQVTRRAVTGFIEELKSKYAALSEVVDYLGGVQDDVLNHAESFQQPKEGEPPTIFGVPLPHPEADDSPLRRYSVNVLIDHAGSAGAPVVYEDNPTHDNLVGRMEHIARMGTLVSDFSLIKAGALHRASGGYLVLDALKLLIQPLAWEALKRALRSREIRIESLGQALGLISTASLEPEPIPLDVKVVLIGQRTHYYLLHAYDPEFAALFKIAADFDDDMTRSADSDRLYARVIANLGREHGLRPLDRAAVGRLIEHAARLAGDQERLSVHVMGLSDVLCEADHCARETGRERVGAEDIDRAVDSQEYRSGRVRARLREEIQRGTLLVDTAGARAGQVNGLSVMQLGAISFGMPHRITAQVHVGSGRVTDIERESELGGPIHSKGVLILSGYLSGHYAPNRPLCLTASLVFEQSYGTVEGDSASSAELYALLSALSGVPIRQCLAVTGSVNQHGDVQAIGGVNEKIEGFFEVCRARGLDGRQGVLIPAANVKHLMLGRPVVEAVAKGQFSVYAVSTIDQGLEILTGKPAGARGTAGRFPEGGVNALVEQRLFEFADRTRPKADDRRRTWKARRRD